MRARQITATIITRLHLVAVGTVLLGAALAAQTSPTVNTTVATSGPTRPCSANPVLSPGTTKKGAHKPKHPLPTEPPPACIEVRGEGIEVQEFLQTTAREETWRLTESHVSEDTWTYVRNFDPDELEKYADTTVSLEPVKFTAGKAAVTVRTTEIGDGYSRVQISAHFQGEGKSADKVMGQPSSVWPLKSKSVLEQELLTALQTRYKPVE